MAFIRYLVATILLVIFIIDCGPKPNINIQGAKTPQRVWDIFRARYADIRSLALEGSFVIKGKQTHDVALQIYFALPDSFAFLAEGMFGADIARGAIIADSGFWEIPREQSYERIYKDDQLILDDYGTGIDIEDLIRAIIFFRNMDKFSFDNMSGSRYTYSHIAGMITVQLEINRDSATPIKQTIYNPNDTEEVNYSDWQVRAESTVLPGHIKINYVKSRLSGEYRIKKVKINPNLPKKLFTPLYNF